MITALAVVVLLLVAAAAVAGAARWLDRPVPRIALAGFLLLAVVPFPQAFVANVTPLPLDHVTYTRPWNFPGSGAPYNPYLNDIATQVLPWTEAVRLAWQDGALPLRDRWNGCGMPLAADSVSAAFWPLTFLALLLPLWRAFTLICSIKLLLAAAGMWLWTRELRASAYSAGFAAVAFALSFTFLPPWILYPQSGVFCLWPWTLFLVERCRDENGRGRATAALCAVFVLTVLAGHPESAAMGFFFTGAWLVLRWLTGSLPDAPRLVGPISLAAAVALGLTAFLLLPSIAAITASARLAVAERPYWQPLLSALPHAPRWPAILPGFFPHSLGNATRSPTVPGGTGTFSEMAMGYAGILCWVAALLVIRPGSRRQRAEWVLWGLLICGFGVAVCLWPLAELFAHIPGLRYVFPLRFNGWVALAAPAIAALELDRYARDTWQRKGSAIAAALLATVLAGCGVALYVYLFPLRRASGGLRFQTWQLAVVLAVLGLAALLPLATRGRPEIYIAGMTLLCGAELVYQWHGLNRLYSPALLYPETPLLRFLHAQSGPFRVAGKGPVLFPSTNVFARLEDIRTHDAVERRDYMAFLDATCGYPYADYFKKLVNMDAPALDFLNVKYVLTEPGDRAPGPRFRAVYEGADGSVFQNLRVLPRAFVPARVRFSPPPRAELWPVMDAAKAFGGAFPEITATKDWRRTAWVLADGPGASDNPPIVVSDYDETTNAAAFSARVPRDGGPGFVVLSLVQDGGWSARDADGAEVPVVLANGPFLAVRLEPGAHRITLTYNPPGFRLGAGVGLATLFLVAVSAARRRARRRSAA